MAQKNLRYYDRSTKRKTAVLKNTTRSKFTTRSEFTIALRFTIAARLVRTPFSWELQTFSSQRRVRGVVNMGGG